MAQGKVRHRAGVAGQQRVDGVCPGERGGVLDGGPAHRRRPPREQCADRRRPVVDIVAVHQRPADAVEHAATFSWAHTVDALLASYSRAMTDYALRHRREPVSRRNGRRFSMLRGIRA